MQKLNIPTLWFSTRNLDKAWRKLQISHVEKIIWFRFVCNIICFRIKQSSPPPPPPPSWLNGYLDILMVSLFLSIQCIVLFIPSCVYIKYNYQIRLQLYHGGQWLAAGQWFSPCTPVSPTNKTDLHDITEILLKVALKKNKEERGWRNM